MSLAEELTRHRDLILSELDAAHDYYTNTLGAWRVVHQVIKRGATITIRNASTGNVTTQADLPDKAVVYARYLMVATFQQFVSLFEDFLFGVMRHWLLAFPQRLGRKQIPVSVVLSAADLDAVKLEAVNRELNELNYKRVREWFFLPRGHGEARLPDCAGDRSTRGDQGYTRRVCPRSRGRRTDLRGEGRGQEAGQRWRAVRHVRGLPPGKLEADQEGGDRRLGGGNLQGVIFTGRRAVACRRQPFIHPPKNPFHDPPPIGPRPAPASAG